MLKPIYSRVSGSIILLCILFFIYLPTAFAQTSQLVYQNALTAVSNHKFDDAVRHLNRLVQNFPNTTQGENAKQLLPIVKGMQRANHNNPNLFNQKLRQFYETERQLSAISILSKRQALLNRARGNSESTVYQPSVREMEKSFNVGLNARVPRAKWAEFVNGFNLTCAPTYRRLRVYENAYERAKRVSYKLISRKKHTERIIRTQQQSRNKTNAQKNIASVRQKYQVDYDEGMSEFNDIAIEARGGLNRYKAFTNGVEAFFDRSYLSSRGGIDSYAEEYAHICGEKVLNSIGVRDSGAGLCKLASVIANWRADNITDLGCTMNPKMNRMGHARYTTIEEIDYKAEFEKIRRADYRLSVASTPIFVDARTGKGSKPNIAVNQRPSALPQNAQDPNTLLSNIKYADPRCPTKKDLENIEKNGGSYIPVLGCPKIAFPPSVADRAVYQDLIPARDMLDQIQLDPVSKGALKFAGASAYVSCELLNPFSKIKKIQLAMKQVKLGKSNRLRRPLLDAYCEQQANTFTEGVEDATKKRILYEQLGMHKWRAARNALRNKEVVYCHKNDIKHCYFNDR